MRMVVVGGTGQIGAKVVALLREQGHDAVAAARSTGVDLVTGEGLADALAGADVVVDTSKPSTYDPDAVLRYFTDSIGALLSAERAAGVRHHVTLTIVGTDRVPEVPFYRAKARMEAIVRASGIPFSIVHATQFFEFAPGIAAEVTRDGAARLPGILVQPVAGAAVAAAVSAMAVGEALDGDRDVAGSEIMTLDAFVRRAAGGSMAVMRDDAAGYFGGHVDERALLPAGAAEIVGPTLDEWLAEQAGAVRPRV